LSCKRKGDFYANENLCVCVCATMFVFKCMLEMGLELSATRRMRVFWYETMLQTRLFVWDFLGAKSNLNKAHTLFLKLEDFVNYR
jgi:hypothetical protein